jgi:hypothetical protein
MNATKKCKGWLAALMLSGIVTTGLVACVTQAEPTVSSEQSEIGTCCSEGTYTCSTNPNLDYDYAPPGCGALLKPRAKTVCDAACGHACKDSGWIDTCP